MTKNPDLILNHARQTALPEKTVKDYIGRTPTLLNDIDATEDFIGTIVDTAKTMTKLRSLEYSHSSLTKN
jgi:hypothetical protein